MENATLNKIWSFLGLASLILSVNGLLLTQGADFSISIGIKTDQEQGPYTASVYGLILSLPVFIMFLLVTHTFIYKNPGGSWVTRFPMAFNTQYKNPTLDVKLYQVTFIFLFLIVTLYSTTHLYKKFLSGTAYMVKDTELSVLSSPERITRSEIDHLCNDHWGLFNERYKYMCKIEGEDKCHGAMSYYPVLQPWVLLFLVLICWLLVIDIFRALWCKKHSMKWLYLKMANKHNAVIKQ